MSLGEEGLTSNFHNHLNKRNLTSFLIFDSVFYVTNVVLTFSYKNRTWKGKMRQLWRSEVTLVGIILLTVVSLVLLSSFGEASSSLSRVKICFKNCGQCKRMLGDYFDGRRCADHCISQKGRFIPDCHDIYSISEFLSRLDY